MAERSHVFMRLTAVSECIKRTDGIKRLGEMKPHGQLMSNMAAEATALTGRSGTRLDTPAVPQLFENEESDGLIAKQGTSAETFVRDGAKEAELKKRQELANQAAQEYNAKYRPYEKAISRGLTGVKETPNGGVSFEDSDALYVKEDGTKAIAVIEATGSRVTDFDRANEALGLDGTPDGYVWHHVDNYNVESNTCTLELVRDDAHTDVIPHAGSCAQYDAVNGPHYNPPRRI